MNSLILLITVIALAVGSMTGDWGAALMVFVCLTIISIIVSYVNDGDA